LLTQPAWLDTAAWAAVSARRALCERHIRLPRASPGGCDLGYVRLRR